DFRTVLQEITASCDLMLVLIGRNWGEAKDQGGRTRLESPNDYVRLEIETALKRNIAVTPVLVQGAQMPAPEELPLEIRDLAYRNGFELGHTRWESDVPEMTRRLGLDAAPVPPPQPRIKRWTLWALAPALVVLALFAGLWKWNSVPSPPLNPSTPPPSSRPATTEDKSGGVDERTSGARLRGLVAEKRGFASLLERNFDESFKSFNEAADLYPDLHNVREIRD